MTQQTVTFLIANTQFDKSAMLDLSPAHTVGTPDHRICGYVSLGSTAGDMLDEQALLSSGDKMVWIDDRRNHYWISKVEMEQQRIWFVGDLIRRR